ncbi:hypothetical protein NQ176_g3224 [Zarea fungicola]|uniref:Uncharacterized protein n=1 Tax=Zarea fungicola TaxID=93591 RepID=A0ACC1NKR1_9HYPO|nr:hypothetical protein NQ176_g3224 [Lecanicillium fungicola]
MPLRKSDGPRKSEAAGSTSQATTASSANANESDPSSTIAAVTEASTVETAGSKSINEGTPTATATSTSTRKGKEMSSTTDHDKTTIEDLALPKSIITRLAKGVLPANTQIQANAILAMSKSATLFISYLASHANEITLNANKKTIMPADVFRALDEIEFDFLKEPLEAEFAKFNAIQTDKRNAYRQKSRTSTTTKPTSNDDTDMAGADSSIMADTTTASATATYDGEDSAPRSKKARVAADAEETEAEDAEMDEHDAVDEDDEDDEDDDENADEVDEEEGGEADSGDDTQDALEEQLGRDERDEALDGDESD